MEPIKQEEGALDGPDPMQEGALEPGTSSRKRLELQDSVVPSAGCSTDVPAKKARTTARLEPPRARFALATESCVTLSVVLPQTQKLVELELKFVMDKGAGGTSGRWLEGVAAKAPPPIKLDLKDSGASVLVKLPGLKLSKSCAGLPSNPACHTPMPALIPSQPCPQILSHPSSSRTRTEPRELQRCGRRRTDRRRSCSATACGRAASVRPTTSFARPVTSYSSGSR